MANIQRMNPGGGVWWANMPLPPGWEAKYDQNSKKYFYVQHATRSTQWVDPRKAYYEHQRGGGIAPGPATRMPQHSPRMPQHSPRMPQHSPRMPMHAGPAIPMQTIIRPKCKTCKITEVPSANQDCQGCQLKARQREAELVRAREAEEAERKKQENQQRIQKEQERRRVQSAARSRTPVPRDIRETSFNTETPERELTAGQKRTLINNLDEAFPGIQKSIVEMVLETSSWDTEKASSVLCTMSPQKPPQATTKAAAPKPKAASASKPEVPAAAAKQTPNQPSDMIKKKMREHLKKTFPSAGETLIDLALETTHFNQARATQVLRMTITPDTSRMVAKKEDSKAKTTTTASAKASAGTSSSTATRSTVAPLPSSQPKPSVPEPSVPKPSPSSSITKPSPSSSLTRPASASTPSSSQVPRQAKTSAAVRAKGPARRTRSAERAPRQEFISAFSLVTQGPDASLVSGPNKDNLLDSYVSNKGSNRSIIQGPNKDNVVGPCNNNGHNISLAIGPQGGQGHYSGPQGNLAKGSMYKADRQM